MSTHKPKQSGRAAPSPESPKKGASRVPLKANLPAPGSNKTNARAGFSTEDAWMPTAKDKPPELKPADDSAHVPTRSGGGLWDEEG
ncbi:MAG: hypothetical protein ACT4TC_10895 [Myxococcaceae bacterium]